MPKIILLFFLTFAGAELLAQTPVNEQTLSMKTSETIYQINGKPVSKRTFKKLLNKLKQVDGTWNCALLKGGGVTTYQAKDKAGVLYRYEGRQQQHDDGSQTDEQSLTQVRATGIIP